MDTATLYLANLLVTSVLTTALSRYIHRHPDLVEEPEARRGEIGRPSFGFVLIGSIAAALIGSLFWSTARCCCCCSSRSRNGSSNG